MSTARDYPGTENRVLSPTEAAEMMKFTGKLPERYVEDLIKTGRLVGRKIGRGNFSTTVWAVLDFIESDKGEPEPEEAPGPSPKRRKITAARVPKVDA